MFFIKDWAEDHRLNLYDATYMVQGFGNVGSWSAKIMKTEGARLLAVEDATGAISNPDGIDPDELAEYVKANRGVKGYPNAKPIEHVDFISTKADIFIPAAMENQITAETAPLLRVKLVAEGANGPTDPDGEIILQKHCIDILPDILCNSGGVIVSYFEWLQNKSSERWKEEKVDGELGAITKDAYSRVATMAKKWNTDWRTASYIIALERLQTVYRERGFFP